MVGNFSLIKKPGVDTFIKICHEIVPIHCKNMHTAADIEVDVRLIITKMYEWRNLRIIDRVA